MNLIRAIRHVIGPGQHLLHQPLLQGNEEKYVKEVLASGHLSAGVWVDKFEKAFAARIGARHAVAVMNATSGLHAAVTAMPQLSEYRLPSLTFVATANALAYGGRAMRFVEYFGYCDIAVDILGHPHFCLGAPLRDAAQSLGTKWHDQYIGATGTAVFSFNQNKIISTGGGGMIVTDDAKLAQELRRLVTTARVWHKWECAHNAVAFNYRMSDVTAAIGCAQLEQLTPILAAKRALALKYIEVFSDIKGIKPIIEPAKAESNYWMNAITLDDPAMLQPVLEQLHAEGIQARPVPTPIHMLEMYRDTPRDDLKKTEEYHAKVICLPSSPILGMKYV